MFLTRAQLVRLTGYRQKAKQRTWLAANGYSFDVRADGTPSLSRAAYEARHAPRAKRRPSALNLAALDDLH